MFSVTFPAEILKLAGDFTGQCIFIAVGMVGGTTESIEQRLVLATPDKTAYVTSSSAASSSERLRARR